MTVTIRFLSRLIKDVDRKVFLILDNLRVHHRKGVRKWLSEHQDQIEVFYLPPYTPEHNPDEYLNNEYGQVCRPGIVTIWRRKQGRT